MQALEIQLAFKAETITRLSEQRELTQSSLRDVTDMYEREGQLTKDIIKDMTRQYKGMQDDLLNKINARESTIQSLRDSLECQKRDFDTSLQSKNRDLEEKGQLIEHLRIHMEELCKHFAQMLSSIMIQMKEKIDSQSDIFRQQSTSIQFKMDELQLD